MTEREVLAALISAADRDIAHRLTKGLAAEEIVRSFLSDYVPRRFGIETGFVKSLDQKPDGAFDVWCDDRQLDVIFTYGDTGLALATQPNAKVFPLEAVIGVMEVTTFLDNKKLKTDIKKVKGVKSRDKRYCVASIARLRQLTRDRGMELDLESAAADLGIPVNELQRGERNYTAVMRYGDLQPRFYYLASTSVWRTPGTVCKNISAASKKHHVHLHGMMILDLGFFRQRPAADPPEFEYIDDPDRAFHVFISQLVSSLMTFDKLPEGTSIPLDAYRGILDKGFKTWNGETKTSKVKKSHGKKTRGRT